MTVTDREEVAARNTVRKSPSRDALVRGLESYALLGLLLLIVLFFAVDPSSSGTFPTLANAVNLLSSQVSQSIIALAVLIPLITGQLDLSVGSIAGLASIADAAAMSRFGAPLVVALFIGIGVGVLVGVANAVMTASFGINSIIVTLGTSTVISGLVQLYTNGLAINAGISGALINFGTEKWLGIPRPGYLLVVGVLGVWYLLEQTPFGRFLRFVGSNSQSANLVGLRVRRLRFQSLVLSGLVAGVAGIVLTATTGGANPQDGPTYLFPALAAVYLGSTAFRPGRFNVWGTVLGVFFVAVAVSGLNLSGVSTWVEPVFTGVALLIAVGLSTLVRRRRLGTVGS